jgi:hypothetical protein
VQPSVQQPAKGLWPIIAGKLAGTISTETSYDEHAQYRGATINPNKRNCFRDGSERHWTTVTPAPRGCTPIDLPSRLSPRVSPREEAAASALIPRIARIDQPAADDVVDIDRARTADIMGRRAELGADAVGSVPFQLYHRAAMTRTEKREM